MAGLIKNQILKHLSKFAKNLSLDQIQLSTLKGEGELRDLELNEVVLTELLDLPSFLILKKASVNRVSLRIPWTKLKSTPIHLSLDEVRVDIETNEELYSDKSKNSSKMGEKTSSSPSKGAQALSGGSSHHYGIVDKVVDGISVSINSAILVVDSSVFSASFQMSRIMLESKSPLWGKGDLRMSRLKDTDKGEVLNFKELTWQTIKIEAVAKNHTKRTKGGNSYGTSELTPLRLITNQARCRLTIKKRISDCNVLGCRLVLLLDDILWVLTDDQLKAAFHFADSLSDTIKQATEETQKVKGARKLKSLSESNKATKSSSKKTTSKSHQTAANSCASAKAFARHDVIETSYHIYTDRIDLHLCDDPNSPGRSCHPGLSDVGCALQLSLARLQLDIYPYHLASASRSTWIRYTEGIHAAWLDSALIAFIDQLLETLLISDNNTKAHNHPPLSRAGYNGVLTATEDNRSKLKSFVVGHLKRLLSATIIVRLANVTAWNVSTGNQRTQPDVFIAGERESLSVPEEVSLLHLEITNFFFPGESDFPIPSPKVFGYVNPLQINIDPLTILWLNAFLLNIEKAVKRLELESAEKQPVDLKIEVIMLRIKVSSEHEYPDQPERPHSLHLLSSRILISNYRSSETGTRSELSAVLDELQSPSSMSLLSTPNFPNSSKDIPAVCEKFVKHATHGDDLQSAQQMQGIAEKSYNELVACLKKDLLWTEAKDVLFVKFEPLWAEFNDIQSLPSKSIPLLDAVPLSVWLYKKPDDDEDNTDAVAKLHILCSVSNPISLQLSHFQLLFLLRLVDRLGELLAFLGEDTKRIMEEDEDSIALALILPQVALSLVMPPLIFIEDEDDEISTERNEPDESEGCFGKGDEKEDESESNKKMTLDESSMVTRSFAQFLADSVSINSDMTPSSSTAEMTSSSRKSSTTTLQSYNAQNPTQRSSMASSPVSSLGSRSHLYSSNNRLSQSFSNMMATLDANSLMENSHWTLRSSRGRDEEDSVSFMSDNDSENFEIISQEEEAVTPSAALFANPNKSDGINLSKSNVDNDEEVEEASEALEDPELDEESNVSVEQRTQRSNDDDGNITENKTSNAVKRVKTTTTSGLVSVLTIYVGRLELAQQAIDGHTAIRLQAASISLHEQPLVNWEDFQKKFESETKRWSSSIQSHQADWCARLRLDTSAPDLQQILMECTNDQEKSSGNKMTLRQRISRAANAKVAIRVQNLPLQLNLSTAEGLGKLFEDEVAPDILPFEIGLSNLTLHLIEDRPKPYPLPPIDVAIPHLLLTRDKSGIICLRPERTGVETDSSSSSNALSVENEALRARLKAAENELRHLRAQVDERESLRRKLNVLQQQQSSNELENASLKQTLVFLQQELVKSGKKK